MAYSFEDPNTIASHQPADWVRGVVRFGSMERNLKGYGFSPASLKKMGSRWPVTIPEALKVDEWCRKNGIVPKEAVMDCFATLVTQDLVVFRWEHCDFPKIHAADMISVELKEIP